MVEFASPKSKTIFESSAFSHKNSRHVPHIRDHFFNHAVEVFLPCCDSLPDDVHDSSPVQQNYYFIKGLPLAELTNADFIQKYIQTGRLYALSVGHHIDTHNVAAILPTGRLILSVNKDTYQELGLEGKPSQYEKPRKTTRYSVEVDLSTETFCKGKKNYERVQWCLKDRLDLTFDFLLAWQPDDATQCLDSLASFWSNRYECHRIQQKQDLVVMRNQTIPVIDSAHLTASPCKSSTDPEAPPTNGRGQSDDHHIRSCEADEVYEWLGAVACQCNRSGSSDDFVCTYRCPEPSQQVSSAVSCRWTGFITSERILHMLETLRRRIEHGTIPWAALTVHGFADSPVSWATREHGFHKFGNNLYTFVIFAQDSRYWLLTGIGNYDLCP